MTWHRNTPLATTTQRGYGKPHQREAQRRRAAANPTDPCAHCGQPLGPERHPNERNSRWHLPHTPNRDGYLPGLAHATCNIKDGAREGRRRQTLRQRHRQSRPWLST